MTSITNSSRLSPPQIEQSFEEPWNILQVDLNSLRYNYRLLRSKIPQKAPFFAVVKADAYGHGIRETAKILFQSGCRHFAVESPQEGIRLRNEGIKGEILLLNPIPEWMAELSVRHDLSVSVIHPSIIQPLEEAAKSFGETCSIHLNVNVGLNRLGIAPSKLLSIAKEISLKPHLKLKAIFGQPRTPETALDAFMLLKESFNKLKPHGLSVDYFHFANSTTFLAHPITRNESVRLGILLYGVLPIEQYKGNSCNLPIKPVMSLETKLVQIRKLPKGSRLGYHSQKKTEKDTTIGIIPLGYYHGLDRKMTKKSYVLIRKEKAYFKSAISMNSSTIDITNIPNASIGDKITIIGRQGDQEISVNDLAENSGTIGAELMMRFGKSIIRTYKLAEKESLTEFTIKQKKNEDITIRFSRKIKELPDWINYDDLTHFLKENLGPYSDTEDEINASLDYALSSNPRGKGFVILATSKRKLLGAVVCVQTNTSGFIPENILIYLCVHRNYRGKGIGERLTREAITCAEGSIKLHVEKSNPAIKLYKKLGFKDDYLEMRLIEEKENTNE